jgi:hypothetical protein
MALTTNAVNTFELNAGLKDDLSETISNISPFDTPFLSSLAKSKASSTKMEWLKDALDSPSASNKQLEGDNYTASAQTDMTRLDNMCQISAKAFAVSGTQNATDHAGMSTYSAYVLAKSGKALRTDQETTLFQNGAKATGNITTARALAGINSWISANTSKGTGGADANGTGGNARTDASTSNRRALTEDMLKAVVKSVWDNGGDATKIYCGSFNKQKISSAFTGGATINADAKDKTIHTSISVYESDFGSLSITPSRHMRTRDLLVLDPSLWGLGVLRDYAVDKLAKISDSESYLLTTEYTLMCKNPVGNGGIFDLTDA